jgi:hypothetical protein
MSPAAGMTERARSGLNAQPFPVAKLLEKAFHGDSHEEGPDVPSDGVAVRMTLAPRSARCRIGPQDACSTPLCGDDVEEPVPNLHLHA